MSTICEDREDESGKATVGRVVAKLTGEAALGFREAREQCHYIFKGAGLQMAQPLWGWIATKKFCLPLNVKWKRR